MCSGASPVHVALKEEADAVESSRNRRWTESSSLIKDDSSKIVFSWCGGTEAIIQSHRRISAGCGSAASAENKEEAPLAKT